MATPAGIRLANAYIQLGVKGEKALKKQLSDVDSQLASAAERWKKISGRIALFGAALGTGILNAVRVAGNFQEVLNRFKLTFAENTTEVRAFGETLAATYDRSRSETLDFLGLFNEALKRANLSTRETIDLSKELTQRVFDYASFRDIKPEEVFERILFAINGTIQGVERLNINLRENKLAEELAKINVEFKDATEAQKIWARTQQIVEQSNIAFKDVLNTAENLNNRFVAAQSALENFNIEVGQIFVATVANAVYVMTEFLKKITGSVEAFPRLFAGFVVVSLAIASFALGVYAAIKSVVAITLAFKGLAIVLGWVKVAFWLANFSLAAFLVTAGLLVAIATVIVGLITLIVKWLGNTVEVTEDATTKTKEYTKALKEQSEAFEKSIKQSQEMAKANFAVADSLKAINAEQGPGGRARFIGGFPGFTANFASRGDYFASVAGRGAPSVRERQTEAIVKPLNDLVEAAKRAAEQRARMNRLMAQLAVERGRGEAPAVGLNVLRVD